MPGGPCHPRSHRQLHRTLRDHRRRVAGPAVGTLRAETVAAMERFMAANGAEIIRADTKAAVLLGFMGAMLGTFMTLTRAAAVGAPHTSRLTTALWWSAVTLTLLAIVSLLCALTPRRRRGRQPTPAAPGYFEDLAPRPDSEPLNRAFERIAHDPTGPLLSSLQRTSEIIRAKYRWIETSIVLLLAALPAVTAVLRMTA